jgi:hypothetical protein
MSFKVGDRVVRVNSPLKSTDNSIIAPIGTAGTIIRVVEDNGGTVRYDNSPTIVGTYFQFLVLEEIYNSPLMNALTEEPLL